MNKKVTLIMDKNTYETLKKLLRWTILNQEIIIDANIGLLDIEPCKKTIEVCNNLKNQLEKVQF